MIETNLRHSVSRLGPFLGLIFIFIAGIITNGSTFLNIYNQLNVLGRIAIIGLPAIGMTLVIISAGWQYCFPVISHMCDVIDGKKLDPGYLVCCSSYGNICGSYYVPDL